MPTERWSFVPRIAAEMDAVTSPSWISLMRAPAPRISSTRSWCRGRSSTIVVMSFARRPNASAIDSTFSRDRAVDVDLPARARPDRHLAHVHVGQRDERSRLADRDHRHRAVAAARDDAAALERVDREVDVPAAEPEDGAVRERALLLPADHDAPLDRQLVERARHARDRRLLGGLRVVAAEPPRGRERRALGRAREGLAEARLAPADRLLAGRLLDGLGHTVSSSAALSSTSSITALDGLALVRVLEHGHTVVACALDDVVLQPADVVEPVEVLLHGPLAAGGCVADPEVVGVRSPRPRSSARIPRRSRRSVDTLSMPGTTWTPSTTIDQPSRIARETAASTATSTSLVWSRNASTSGCPGGASKLERWIDGISAGGKNARSVCRTTSVHVTRLMPRRCADLGGDRGLARPRRAADEEDDRLHAGTFAGSRSRIASSSPSPETSFAASTSSAPRAAASSATTSIAAAFSSTT